MAETTRGAQPQEINLGQLDIDQLNNLKTQFETELRQYTTSYSGLKQAQSRFQESNSALDELMPENEGKKMLVPLTSSIYAPGTLSQVSQVLVEVGTGYFVEKEVPEAKKFMDRKIEFLQSNTESLQQVIETKRSQLEMVIGFMQQKLRTKENTGSS